MKVAFAGTPEFARSALQALLDAGFDVPLVLTQPDRPGGRGMRLQASAVKQLAVSRGIAVAQPRSLRLDGKYPQEAGATQAALHSAAPDIMVVAAYGLILPEWVLSLPRLGCLNIHASLLPRWRGAAPIHRAIEAGDHETGITVMQMDAGLDTGDMLLVKRLPIGEQETTATLHGRLAELGGALIVEALHQAACGHLQPVAQPEEGVTYAHKITKDEAVIDWAQPAAVIERRVRAFNPFPGASTTLDGRVLKIWGAEVAADGGQLQPGGQAGQILAVDDASVVVACGEGALRLTLLQRAGGRRLPVHDFLAGFPIASNQVMGQSRESSP